MKNKTKYSFQDKMNSAGALEIKAGEEVSMTRAQAMKKLGLTATDLGTTKK